jgi:hypothetical protein
MTSSSRHISNVSAARSDVHIAHIFELRGAAGQDTVIHFMDMWQLLADLATTDAARARALRHRTDWSLIAPERLTAA